MHHHHHIANTAPGNFETEVEKEPAVARDAAARASREGTTGVEVEPLTAGPGRTHITHKNVAPESPQRCWHKVRQLGWRNDVTPRLFLNTKKIMVQEKSSTHDSTECTEHLTTDTRTEPRHTGDISASASRAGVGAAEAATTASHRTDTATDATCVFTGQPGGRAEQRIEARPNGRATSWFTCAWKDKFRSERRNFGQVFLNLAGDTVHGIPGDSQRRRRTELRESVEPSRRIARRFYPSLTTDGGGATPDVPMLLVRYWMVEFLFSME